MPEERAQILEWSGAGSPPPEETFPALFEAQVERTPDAPAVTHAKRTLTYRELDRQANRLARHLRRQGVGPETRVAIRFQRSPEMLVAIVGIWKAGGAYLPLDPAMPPERRAFPRREAAAAPARTGEARAGGALRRAGWPPPPRDPATPPERVAVRREEAAAVLELTDEALAGLDLSRES